jgi:hypothetical protein
MGNIKITWACAVCGRKATVNTSQLRGLSAVYPFNEDGTTWLCLHTDMSEVWVCGYDCLKKHADDPDGMKKAEPEAITQGNYVSDISEGDLKQLFKRTADLEQAVAHLAWTKTDGSREPNKGSKEAFDRVFDRVLLQNREVPQPIGQDCDGNDVYSRNVLYTSVGRISFTAEGANDVSFFDDRGNGYTKSTCRLVRDEVRPIGKDRNGTPYYFGDVVIQVDYGGYPRPIVGYRENEIQVSHGDCCTWWSEDTIVLYERNPNFKKE